MVGRQRSHAHDHMPVLICRVIDIPALLVYMQKHQVFEFSDSPIPLLDLRPLLLCGGSQARGHDLEVGRAFLLSRNVPTNKSFSFRIRCALCNALLQSRLEGLSHGSIDSGRVLLTPVLMQHEFRDVALGVSDKTDLSMHDLGKEFDRTFRKPFDVFLSR